jgi:hypothetical protein
MTHAATDGMGDQDDQRTLFPPDDGDALGSRRRWNRHARRSIAPGDWLSIEHEGKTVVGMIYRCQDDAYTFVYWDARVLRFGTTTLNSIGPWDEELTSQFRGQVAIHANYVEKCIAAWLMQPEQAVRPKLDVARWKSRKVEPVKVQLRLFPE